MTEANRYADQWIEVHTDYLMTHPPSRVHNWIKQGQPSAEEIKAFFSVIMNMGLNKKPELSDHCDSISESQKILWFADHFNQDRFQLLLKFLHFSDNQNIPLQEDPDYKLYKVKLIIDELQRTLKKYSAPYQHVIDKSMVGYHGKTPHLRQYMPYKHNAKFGIKLWCLCDTLTKYTSMFEVYKENMEHENDIAHGTTYYAADDKLQSAVPGRTSLTG